MGCTKMNEQLSCPLCRCFTSSYYDHCEECGAPLIVGRQLGDYLILGCLGGGGAGAVYHARDLNVGGDVAIKLLRYEPLQKLKTRARFLREVQLTSRLQHPNIVEISNYGHDDLFGPFMVMEYLDGAPLSEVLARGVSLPWPHALHIAITICDTMQYAHEQGVIHRDLKPANLFVLRTLTEEMPRIKIVDFGIAKSVEDDLVAMTQSGSLLGTPVYMSPEQVRRTKATHRSDLYTLGIVLFQMLTGSLPFSGKSAMAVLMKRLTEYPPLLSALLPRFQDTCLEETLAIALQREPQHRWASMADLGDRLRIAYAELEQMAFDGFLPSKEEVGASTEGQLFVAWVYGEPTIEDETDESQAASESDPSHSSTFEASYS